MGRGTGRPLAALVLSDEERSFLEAQVRRHRVARSLSDRCRMILRCADGLGNKAVAAELGMHEHTVGKWRRRFVKNRIEGLSDEPRPGRPRSIADEKVAEVIERTLTSTPADATHWSLRSMAKEAGLSHTSIWRLWGAFGLQPHRAETFKLSADPHFVDKVRDIVGLYLSPPDRALVLCVDEKSRIQALDRTQPVLPMLPGIPERRTHDYKRNGTTSLFAALDIATGAVIAKCYRRHRAREFLDFLKVIDRNVPDGLDIPHRHGQLRHPQDRRGQSLAGPAAALARPLHADIRLVAQPGRALVRRTDPQAVATGRPPLDPATRNRHPGLHRNPQRKSQALQMDKVR